MKTTFKTTHVFLRLVAYGRYDWQYGTQGPPELVLRDGGHAVTLKLAFADNGQERGNRLIHYRDPATDDGNQ